MNLKEKVACIPEIVDNTNIEAAFELVLETAVNNNRFQNDDYHTADKAQFLPRYTKDKICLPFRKGRRICRLRLNSVEEPLAKKATAAQRH